MMASMRRSSRTPRSAAALRWALQRATILAVLCLASACEVQPGPSLSPPPVGVTLTPVATHIPGTPSASSSPAPVVNMSQLLPSGIRIEEHALVRRPEIEPLVLRALDGENEV